MKFINCLNDFCEKHEYDGRIGYDDTRCEYEIILSKDGNNAGAFLNDKEWKTMDEQQLRDLLEYLHKGFQVKFNQ